MAKKTKAQLEAELVRLHVRAQAAEQRLRTAETTLHEERDAHNSQATHFQREISGLRTQLRNIGIAVEHEALQRAKLAVFASDARAEGSGWMALTSTKADEA